MAEGEVIDVPFEEDDFEENTGTFRTYKMDFEKKRIVGMVDGIEAANQAIFKALQTRRYAHLIYDEQYGCDIFNKIGDSDLTKEYLDSDIPVMVEDALLPEDMVTGISEIDFNIIGEDSVLVGVEVQTIFGDFEMEGVITDGKEY